MAVFGRLAFKAIADAIYARYCVRACYAKDFYKAKCNWGFRFITPPRFVGTEQVIIKQEGQPDQVDHKSIRCIYDAYIELFAEFCCNVDIGIDQEYDKVSRCFSPNTATIEEENEKTYVVFNIGAISFKIDKASDRKYNLTTVDINCIEYIQEDAS